MIGRTVGKYRIIDRLGRGGMGTVYKAVDETLDREVAIKVLNPDLTDSELLKRFRAEAVTLARLNHPGIATLYELHRQDDDLLMVMEFVRGETFHDLSERLGPLAPPQAAHLCMQVLDALAHAHRAGVVHRDLKPANLMVSETGAVKVMDFGIARVLGTEHFTHGGYMMGTPAYMAPEQVMGRDVDARADLYAIGVVVYRLLSGQLPFEADTAIAMVQKQISDPPTPISHVLPGPAVVVRDDSRSRAAEVANRSIPERGGVPRGAARRGATANARRDADVRDAHAAGIAGRSRPDAAARLQSADRHLLVVVDVRLGPTAENDRRRGCDAADSGADCGVCAVHAGDDANASPVAGEDDRRHGRRPRPLASRGDGRGDRAPGCRHRRTRLRGVATQHRDAAGAVSGRGSAASVSLDASCCCR